jgi:hypothetical protein
LWWANLGPRSPAYNGRPISEMLEESTWREQTGWELNKAVRQLQGNAVPYLVYVLKKEPTTPQRLYHDIYFRAPQSIQKHLPEPSDYEHRRRTCAGLLGLTGSNGVAQIPLLVQLSKEGESGQTRVNALSALAQLGPGSIYESVALEALIAATQETGAGYGWLVSFRNRAPEVVPVLLKGIEKNPKELDVFQACFHGLKIFGGTNHPLIRAAIDRGEADFLSRALEGDSEGGLR